MFALERGRIWNPVSLYSEDMSTPNNTVSEWLLSSDFSFTHSIFPEGKPFTFSSSMFTMLPSNVFQC